jgi:asparaginyl-tRNA synthetase
MNTWMKIDRLNQDPGLLGKSVEIKGWVRTIRVQKNVAFVQVNDGSTLSGLQAVALEPESSGLLPLLESLTTGTSVSVTGQLQPSPSVGQPVELKLEKLEIIGSCDAQSYPLQKKRHSLEFLREIGHLRPRSNTIGAVARLRHTLSQAIHRFFDEKGFFYIHTPIITASDCEGAGQMFKVTTLEDKQLGQRPIDYAQDFFGRQAYLTVSGQLNGEIYACALGNVYTFGPTFRAENSNTSRHLAEFWMVEPEMAFVDLAGNKQVAYELLQYCVKAALKERAEDMEFFDKFIRPGLKESLENFLSSGLQSVTYTEAVDILLKSKKTFQYPVEWGCDLQSEHERYLCEEHFKGPVAVTNYPKGIKAFYMRQNEDGKTVAAMDILVPQIGEIIGGSQREERYDHLMARLKEMGLHEKDYWWYLDLRRYGSVPHSGFGLGFERLVLWISGVENIRDAIAFPRYPGHADF